MPKSEILTAYEEFYEELKGTEYLQQFQPFFDAIKAADDAMSALHQRDRYGRIPLLTAERRDMLMQLHEALGREAETLIANEAVPEEKKDVVKKLASLGAANYRHFRAYDPKHPVSLPELLEDVRTLTLDTRDAVLKRKMGAVQNARQPLTFIDDSGKEITGLFTPKKVSNIWKHMEDMLKANVPKTDISAEGKEILNGIMNKLDTPYGAECLGLPADADRSAKLAALYMQVIHKRKGSVEDEIIGLVAKLYSTPEHPMTPEEAAKKLGKHGVQIFDLALTDQGTPLLNNNIIAKMHDGARLDNRNAAMSSVAELLNVPNLLAKSVPMKIIDKSGNEIEGTFMKQAVGVDVGNLAWEHRNLGTSSMKNHDGRAMKQLADLQILDYICGNMDRHAANMLYQFDDNGKLIGVQGIDNDTAFGTAVPKYGDFVGHMTLPENMLAVSESMARRLHEITPEILKFSLRGYGLTEPELNAAVERMNVIKKAIEKGAKQQGKEAPDKKDEGVALRVLKDEQWKKIDWKTTARTYEYERYKRGKLTRSKGSGNLFTKAYNGIYSIASQWAKQGRNYESLKSKNAIGNDNRAIPTNLKGMINDMKVIEREMGKRSNIGQSSGKYRAMQKSVSDYRKYLEKLQTRIKKAKGKLKAGVVDPMIELDAVITQGDLSDMQQFNRNMKSAATDYLGTKDPNRKYETYTQRRIDIAGFVSKTAESGMLVSEEEANSVERNERRASERANRRMGDILEKEDNLRQQKQNGPAQL